MYGTCTAVRRDVTKNRATGGGDLDVKLSPFDWENEWEDVFVQFVY
jgi:hypothetical protein